MRRKAYRLVLLVAGLAIGCGGGGGSDGTTESLAYRGVADPAAVDAENAGDLAEAASSGTEIGLGVQEVGAVTGGGALRVSAPRVAHAAVMEIVSSERLLARSAAAAIPFNEPGDCGGEIRGEVELAGTGFLDFDATFTFMNYCSGGTTLDGRITASARTEPDGNTVVVTESFPFLRVDDGAENLALGGTVHARTSVLDSTGVVTLNFTVEDLNSGEQIRLEDYVVEQSETPEGSALAVRGRVYHSAHGYVDVTTDATSPLASPYDIPEGVLAPLVTSPGADRPSSGGVLLVGSGGSAALLSVVDEAHYDVIVDENGDRVFDLQADVHVGPVTWQ